MQKIITYAKLGCKFAKGILGIRKKEYDLTFVYEPEDNLWYIDMPWPGDRYNLAMVAGSDKLLDRLSNNDREQGFRHKRSADKDACLSKNSVRVLVDPCKKPHKDLMENGYIECVKQYSTTLGGATYRVNGMSDFNREIWICPVTLTVLGHYPNYIYIKKIQ